MACRNAKLFLAFSLSDSDNLSKLFINPTARGPKERIIYDLIPCHQAADRGGKEWFGLKTHDMTYTKGINDNDGVLFKNSDDPFQLHNLWNDEKLKRENQKIKENRNELKKMNPGFKSELDELYKSF